MANRPERILEIGNGLPIWYTGRLLQGLGLQVRRVEPPGGIPIDDADRDGYRVLNSGKPIFEADLRSEAGRAQLLVELGSTDVLLLSVRPARAAQWGLDPRSLAHLPLVHAWLNAFGESGPYANLAAHDINASAVSGVSWIEGLHEHPGAQPMRSPISDITAGLFMVIAVLDAFRERAAGSTTMIRREISMADAGLAFLAAWAPGTLAGRLEALEPTPFYGTYRTRDGVSVAIGAVETRQQSALLRIAGVADGGNRVSVENTIRRLVSSMDAEALFEIARQNSIALTPVREPWNVLDDPHMCARLSESIDAGDPWRRVLDPSQARWKRRPGETQISLKSLLFGSIDARWSQTRE